LGYKFHFNLNKSLPKLAWIGRIGRSLNTIEVIHGSSVECENDFMVEGVWDGSFEKGNFHRSQHFFGSGIKLADGKVYISTSSSSIDRILFCEFERNFLFSNSLILLLAYTGAKLDPNHNYEHESLSVCMSRNQYNRRFTIIHPEIKNFYQVFHENIIYDQGQIGFEYRYEKNKINSYGECLAFMNHVLAKFRKNYESDKRRIVLNPFSMLSVGYNSTAVSALVKNIGVKSVFIASRLKHTIHKATKADEVAGAKQIAKKLGYDVLFLDNKRATVSEDELYFLSTTYPKHHSGSWSELGLHLMAKYIEQNCDAGVVFSGHHGDSVWDSNIPKSHLEEVRVPNHPFGFCSEMRLKSGFINIPLPGILATNIKDIAEISHSLEMAPWRLHNSYDRPIPRRIAEEAGVDRNLFGVEKNWVATMYHLPINSHLRKSFFKYLRSVHHIHPMMIYLQYLLNLFSKLPMIGGMKKSNVVRSKGFENSLLGKDIDLYFLMTVWATEKLSSKMARILGKTK
jgi:hypothetical protein